jgi:hypothetical protein
VEKAVQTWREDLAPHHGAAVLEQVGLDARFAGGVVIYLIGVAFDPSAGILFKIKTLLGLQGEVFLIALVHLRGDEQLLYSDGFRGNFPAIGTEIGDAVLVGGDPFGIGCGGGGGLPYGGEQDGN